MKKQYGKRISESQFGIVQDQHLKLIDNGVSCELCGTSKILLPADLDIYLAELDLFCLKHERKHYNANECRAFHERKQDESIADR